MKRWVDWLRAPRQRALISTFIHSLLPTLGALALQLVAFAVTARGLGIEQFGRYTAVLALVGVAVDVVGLGTTDLLVRAVATERTAFSRHWGQVLKVVAWSLPPVAALAMWLAVGWMQLDIALPLLMLALLAEIAVARAAATAELVMVAHEHTVRAAWLRVTVVLTRLLAAALFFLALQRSDLQGWIVTVALQSAVAIALCGWLVTRLYGVPAIGGVPKQFWAGVSFCVTQVARAAQGNMDRIILARVGTDAALGAYGAATRFMQLGMFPVQVATRMLYPKFFVHGAAGPAAIWRFAVKSAAVMAGIGAVAAAAMALAGMAAPWVLGSSYEASVAICWKLALALPLIALQYPAADTLSGLNRQALRASAATGFTLLFGAVLLASALAWGLDGVVWGFVAAHGFVAAGYWLLAWRCAHSGRPDST